MLSGCKYSKTIGAPTTVYCFCSSLASLTITLYSCYLSYVQSKLWSSAQFSVCDILYESLLQGSAVCYREMLEKLSVCFLVIHYIIYFASAFLLL